MTNKFPMVIKLELIKQVEVEAETYEQAVIDAYQTLESDSKVIEHVFDYYMEDYVILKDFIKNYDVE